MEFPIKAKVGDKFVISGGMGVNPESTETVTKVTVHYDEATGKPYDIIWFGLWEFDSRSGVLRNHPAAWISKKSSWLPPMARFFYFGG